MSWLSRRERAEANAARAEVAVLRERVTELEAALAERERELETSAVAVNDALAAVDSLVAGKGGGAEDEGQPAERSA